MIVFAAAITAFKTICSPSAWRFSSKALCSASLRPFPATGREVKAFGSVTLLRMKAGGEEAAALARRLLVEPPHSFPDPLP
jgi:hypothetical protein